jgi:hypothetical protein
LIENFKLLLASLLMTTTNFVVNLAVDHCCLSRRRSFLNQTTFINMIPFRQSQMVEF